MTLKNAYLIFILLLIACQQPENQSVANTTAATGTNFVDLFTTILDSAYIVNIDDNLIKEELPENECISLIYQPYFEGFLTISSPTSTGLKPIGKMALHNGNYFLITMQQDDYGGFAYGLILDGKTNKIIQKEVIAEYQGDAGDLSLMQSYIEQHVDGLLISKTIQVWNADLEVKGEEVIITNETSWDSVAIVNVKQDLTIEEITTYRETK